VAAWSPMPSRDRKRRSWPRPGRVWDVDRHREPSGRADRHAHLVSGW